MLRLSAIGDVVTSWRDRKLQARGRKRSLRGDRKARTQLLGHIQIEFVVYDKQQGIKGLRALRRQFKGRQFDLLMHMQLAIRASAVATVIPARTKLGFDVSRARELQWMFTTHRIERSKRQHVMDSFFGFAERLGVRERLLRWDIPIPDAAREYAQNVIPDGEQALVISPCSSHRLRNWRASTTRKWRTTRHCLWMQYVCAADAATWKNAWPPCTQMRQPA